MINGIGKESIGNFQVLFWIILDPLIPGIASAIVYNAAVKGFTFGRATQQHRPFALLFHTVTFTIFFAALEFTRRELLEGAMEREEYNDHISKC